MPRSAARALAFCQATRVSGLFCSARLTSSGRVYVLLGSGVTSGVERAGGTPCMVPCHGWLGEAGALWAHAIPAAQKSPSMVTELVRDSFIPDATCRAPVEPISYRCIPQATVLHSQEENSDGATG